jgi:hypothetical protein
MIITSHMQTIIKIHPCLLKLSRKPESVTDGRYYYIPHHYSKINLFNTYILIPGHWSEGLLVRRVIGPKGR